MAGGITTTYVYDGSQFLEERPSAGSPKRYVYGPRIDQPLAQVSGGAVSYNVADHLGSIVKTTNSAGSTVLTREYDPWGNPLQGTTTSGYAFTGREWDPEIQAYYYRARYYDPKVGRFLAEDPAGSVDNVNLYLYAASNPVRFVDPSGLCSVSVRCRPVEGYWPFKHCYIIVNDDQVNTLISGGPDKDMMLRLYVTDFTNGKDPDKNNSPSDESIYNDPQAPCGQVECLKTTARRIDAIAQRLHIRYSVNPFRPSTCNTVAQMTLIPNGIRVNMPFPALGGF